jgi:predicted ATPase
LRDVTYENVLKRLRKIYHGYAAAWLETITEQSRRSGEYAALIADHYERADDREKARTWYERAGYQAADTYANAEIIRCLTHCLELWPEE